MDLTRLNQGEKIAAGAGVALFVFMFFKWFGVSVDTDFGSFGASVNAWDGLSWIRWVLLLTVLAAVAFPLLKASGNEIEIPVPPVTIITLLGGLSVLLILFRIIDPPGSGIGREIGIFLGLIAAGAVTYGGYTAMQEEGTSFQETADHFGGSGGNA